MTTCSRSGSTIEDIESGCPSLFEDGCDKSDVWFELDHPVDSLTPKLPQLFQPETLRVSNQQVQLPTGLFCRSDFVDNDERDRILKEISEQAFVWEGFDQRRRVWRFLLPTQTRSDNQNGNFASVEAIDGTSTIPPPPPPGLLSLARRIEQETNMHGQYLSVEEFPKAKWTPSGEYASHQRVTTFESLHFPPTFSGNTANTTAPSADEQPTPPSHDVNVWFVAQIALNQVAIQHINQPAKRVANYWKLKTPNHQTDLWMNPGSLWIKTGSCLWDWRHQIRAAKDDRNTDTENGHEDVVLMFKLYKLPETQADGGGTCPTCDDQFGYIPRHKSATTETQHEAQTEDHGVRPPLPDLLTIVITTSPIRSNPSTNLIETIMKTFIHAGRDFAYKCRKVIVCDGYRISSANKSSQSRSNNNGEAATPKRYGNLKQAMRNGIVSDEQAERYRQFKVALTRLCQEAKQSESQGQEHLFQNTTVEELDERQGYGFALRHALQHCVSTQFVCVVQHDRTFMRPVPMQAIVSCMRNHPGIKVCKTAKYTYSRFATSMEKETTNEKQPFFADSLFFPHP